MNKKRKKGKVQKSKRWGSEWTRGKRGKGGVSWSLTSLFSTNMAISETREKGGKAGAPAHVGRLLAAFFVIYISLHWLGNKGNQPIHNGYVIKVHLKNESAINDNYILQKQYECFSGVHYHALMLRLSLTLKPPPTLTPPQTGFLQAGALSVDTNIKAMK